MEIYIGITLRSNTSCHITDCHAGNPCVHKLDQTAKIKAPMIGKMDGYDWQEHVEQGRPRSSLSLQKLKLALGVSRDPSLLKLVCKHHKLPRIVFSFEFELNLKLVQAFMSKQAKGLTDGGVIIFERQESEGKWGCDKLKNCKSFEELKEARTRDKELFEQTKEENKKQYEETLNSQALTMKEEMMKEASVKIAEIWTLRGNGGESFWEEGDDFGVDVLCFHTCLIDILGFLEKFGWWFEQDIGGESEDDREKKLVMVSEEGWMS
ncbi:hypothetical protein Tco_1430074 [Tanacetum coccineum]